LYSISFPLGQHRRAHQNSPKLLNGFNHSFVRVRGTIAVYLACLPDGVPPSGSRSFPLSLVSPLTNQHVPQTKELIASSGRSTIWMSTLQR
jgi:phage terminase Nu1 subunit (DNA packaging protein)